MNYIKNILITSIFISSSFIHAETVVYTTKSHEPTNLNGEKVVYIDQPDTLLNEMFGALSSDPNQAQAQAIATIQSPYFQQKQQVLSQAFDGVITANNLGLKKVPAIVFNDKYVVYGTADLKQAQAIYEKMGTE